MKSPFLVWLGRVLSGCPDARLNYYHAGASFYRTADLFRELAALWRPTSDPATRARGRAIGIDGRSRA
jgi:hypothetical protein